MGRIIDQLVWPEKNTSEDMCAKEVCVFFVCVRMINKNIIIKIITAKSNEQL